MASLETPAMTAAGGLVTLRPQTLEVGCPGAVFVEAWGFDQRAATVRADLRCAGTVLAAVAVGIEREDVFNRFVQTPVRSAHAHRSGLCFAGVVVPVERGRHELLLRLHLEDGRTVSVAIGSITVVERSVDHASIPSGTEVCVAMATYDPDPALFAQQIDSLRRQDDVSWACVISDDHSSRRRRTEMRAAIADDPRFVFVGHRDRTGFYRNFERALALVPPTVSYVALCDQDDRWQSHKLTTQLAMLRSDPATAMVASDVRLVGYDNEVVADTFYADRRPTHDEPENLFAVNSLVGASMVFRRGLLDVALPFPHAFLNRYHDHWLARVALACGGVKFIDQALHDYVQHAGNVLGSRRQARDRFRPKLRMLIRDWLGGELPPEWYQFYIDFVLEISVTAQLVQARWPEAAELPFVASAIEPRHGDMTELARLVLHHALDNRRGRPGCENVDMALFAGRTWALDHRPGALA